MKATVWEKAGVTLVAQGVHTGMNRLNGEHYVELTDGMETFIVHPDDLKETATEITEDLVPRDFQHTMTMSVGGDQDQTVRMLDQTMMQCMQLTGLRTVPFAVIDEAEVNQVKEKRTTMSEAVGYWHRANCFLDHELVPGEDEPQLVIRVVLYGVIFAARFGDDDKSRIEEHELSENYQVRPRFNHNAIETLGGSLGMDFDLVRIQGEPEFEEVSEEEEAELNLKH